MLKITLKSCCKYRLELNASVYRRHKFTYGSAVKTEF